MTFCWHWLTFQQSKRKLVIFKVSDYWHENKVCCNIFLDLMKPTSICKCECMIWKKLKVNKLIKWNNVVFHLIAKTAKTVFTQTNFILIKKLYLLIMAKAILPWNMRSEMYIESLVELDQIRSPKNLKQYKL